MFDVISRIIPVIKVYKLIPLLFWNNKLPNEGIISNSVHQPGKNILYFGSTIISIVEIRTYIHINIDVLIL